MDERKRHKGLDVLACLGRQSGGATPAGSKLDAVVQAPQEVRHDRGCQIQTDRCAGQARYCFDWDHLAVAVGMLECPGAAFLENHNLVSWDVELAQAKVHPQSEEHEALARRLPTFRRMDNKPQRGQKAPHVTVECPDAVLRAHQQNVVDKLDHVASIRARSNQLDDPSHALDYHKGAELEPLWQASVMVVLKGFVRPSSAGQDRMAIGVDPHC